MRGYASRESLWGTRRHSLREGCGGKLADLNLLEDLAHPELIDPSAFDTSVLAVLPENQGQGRG